LNKVAPIFLLKQELWCITYKGITNSLFHIKTLKLLRFVGFFLLFLILTSKKTGKTWKIHQTVHAQNVHIYKVRLKIIYGQSGHSFLFSKHAWMRAECIFFIFFYDKNKRSNPVIQMDDHSKKYQKSNGILKSNTFFIFFLILKTRQWIDNPYFQ
jgi:hypothetical protein